MEWGNSHCCLCHIPCVRTSCTLSRTGFLPAPLTVASCQDGRLRAWKATQGDPKSSSHRELGKQENSILQKPVLYLASLFVKSGERWLLEPELPGHYLYEIKQLHSMNINNFPYFFQLLEE